MSGHSMTGTSRTTPEQDRDAGMREALTEALDDHRRGESSRDCIEGIGWVWACWCDCGWHGPDRDHQTHQADALLPVVEEHVRRAREEAASSFHEEVMLDARRQAEGRARRAEAERDALRERLARVEALVRDFALQDYEQWHGDEIATLLRAALGDAPSHEGRTGGADGGVAGAGSAAKVDVPARDERPSDRRTANEGDA